MPTNNPRLSVTLPPADLAVLDRYAKATGTPRATLVAGLIKATIPQLEEAAELIELANAAPRKIKQDLVDNLSNATADAMGFLQPFHGSYRTVMDSLQRELIVDPPVGARPASPSLAAQRHGGGGRARSTGVVPPDPHLLTGGSKS
jgi:hypothetical protein